MHVQALVQDSVLHDRVAFFGRHGARAERVPGCFDVAFDWSSSIHIPYIAITESYRKERETCPILQSPRYPAWCTSSHREVPVCSSSRIPPSGPWVWPSGPSSCRAAARLRGGGDRRRLCRLRDSDLWLGLDCRMRRRGGARLVRRRRRPCGGRSLGFSVGG